MTELEKRPAGLFVEVSAGQWIVRDPAGDFWALPAVENPWDHRTPIRLTEETELEPVPGHYRDMLGIPF